MSETTFLIGCTHFGHDNMYKFIDIYGNKVRPFENAKEADGVMLENTVHLPVADDVIEQAAVGKETLAAAKGEVVDGADDKLLGNVGGRDAAFELEVVGIKGAGVALLCLRVRWTSSA